MILYVAKDYSMKCIPYILSAAPIILYILMLCFVPKGIWKMGRKSRAVPQVADEAENRRISELEALGEFADADSKEERSYFYSKLTKAIDYAIGRHDWYEKQRLNILQLSLGTGTVIFAICGLAVKLLDPIPSEIIAFCIYSVLLAVFGIWIALLRYNAELDGDRPYRLVSDIRFWYFRYNIPTHSESVSGGSVLNSARSVLRERANFIDRISKNFTLKNSIREDLEQIFILQVLQRYKSESLTRMRWSLVYLICCFTIQVLLTIFLLIS